MKTEDIEYNGQVFTCRKIIDLSAMIELLSALAKKQQYIEKKLDFQEERIDDKDKRISDLEVKIIGSSKSKEETFPFDNMIEKIKEKEKNEEEEKKMKNIQKNTKLEEFLMDEKQEKGGEQIRELYKILIGIQNDFIKENVNNLIQLNNISKDKKNKQIEYVLEQLNSSNVNIQNVSGNEIIDIENELINLENLLKNYSKRKCFRNDLKIDYEKYNEIEINYGLIDEEIRNNLLYGKKYFSKHLNYIRYDLEFSSNINEFVKLHKYTKCSIDNGILSNIENLENYLLNLEKLIFYISHNKYESDDLAMKALDMAIKGKITKFENEFIKFINENKIKIKELPGLYDLIEENIFNQKKSNMKFQEYLEELDNGILSKKINDNLKPLLKTETKYIKEENLLRAIRKYVMKNLFDKKEIKIEDKKLLKQILLNDELWLESSEKRKVDFEKIEEIFENQTQIMVKHTYLFYENLVNEKINSEIKKKMKINLK